MKSKARLKIHTSNYTCNVQNLRINASKNMTLTILSKPKVQVHPTSISIPINSWKLVKCIVQSNPPPFSITWHKKVDDVVTMGGFSVNLIQATVIIIKWGYILEK